MNRDEWWEVKVYWTKGERAGMYGSMNLHHSEADAMVEVDRNFELGFGTDDTEVHLFHCTRKIVRMPEHFPGKIYYYKKSPGEIHEPDTV